MHATYLAYITSDIKLSWGKSPGKWSIMHYFLQYLEKIHLCLLPSLSESGG